MAGETYLRTIVCHQWRGPPPHLTRPGPVRAPYESRSANLRLTRAQIFNNVANYQLEGVAFGTAQSSEKTQGKPGTLGLEIGSFRTQLDCGSVERCDPPSPFFELSEHAWDPSRTSRQSNAVVLDPFFRVGMMQTDEAYL